jgi:uncharacterized membrane protein
MIDWTWFDRGFWFAAGGVVLASVLWLAYAVGLLVYHYVSRNLDDRRARREQRAESRKRAVLFGQVRRTRE